MSDGFLIAMNSATAGLMVGAGVPPGVVWRGIWFVALAANVALALLTAGGVL